ITKSTKSQSFCTFHKSKGHNTSECIAYSNWKKRNSNFTPKNKTDKQDVLSIHTNNGPKLDTKSENKNKVFLKIELNNTPTNFIVDTDSDYNFILRDIADKVQNADRITSKNVFNTLADGTNIEIKGKLLVRLKEHFVTQQEEYFYIISDLPYDVLIGQKFLQNMTTRLALETTKDHLK
ncbi:hypothetical protein NGRA_3561, partial [Nosema granulosis]